MKLLKVCGVFWVIHETQSKQKRTLMEIVYKVLRKVHLNVEETFIRLLYTNSVSERQSYC